MWIFFIVTSPFFLEIQALDLLQQKNVFVSLLLQRDENA